MSVFSRTGEYLPKYVADEVSVTSIDENWDLFEYSWNQTMEWLHPVTGEQEISINVKITAVIATNFNAKL